MKATHILYIFLIFFTQISTPLAINKVIIYGHKLHSHTHSYIHWGFYRAFKHLGYEVYWVDTTDDIQSIDCSHALFLTEGQADHNMPLRKDCFYILHNCTHPRYQKLREWNNYIILQVYTHDCKARPVTSIDTCMCYDINERIIYLPWATDLLPHEIEQQKQRIAHRTPSRDVYFVGSIWGSHFGNARVIHQFKRACRDANYHFVNRIKISMDDNIACIQRAYMAPALQGEWQCKQGYIPCRIFKNMSYGHWGITNSQTVYELFNRKIIYDPNPYKLFFTAKKYIEQAPIEELYELMDIVKTKHTYVNRIHALLTFFDMVIDTYKN